MQSFPRRLVSVLLAFVLAFSSCPVAAAFALGEEGSTVAEESVTADEDTASEEDATVEEDAASEDGAAEDESGDAAAEDDSEDATDADVDADTSDADAATALDAIEYIYLDATIVALGEEQNIAVALADESATIASATLVLASPETGAELTVEASELDANAVLFTIVFEDEDDATCWELVTLSYTLEGSDEVYEIELAFEDDTYLFDVVSEETAEVLDSSEDADSDDVTVAGINEDGELEAVESVEEALELASAATAAASSSSSDDDDDLVVALDPGHGGSDGGASYNGLTESELNWTIMTYCKAELETYDGVKVVVTKTENETLISRETRVKRAVNAGADVIVSIHCNAGGGSGAEVYVPNDSSYFYELHTIGEDLGEAIQEQLVALGLKDRGVLTRDSESGDKYDDGSVADYYGIIRYARENGIVGIIVEHAYLDNSSNAAFLKKESNLKKLGVADATGIANYYGLTKATFSDVRLHSSYYYDAVYGLYDLGYIEGYSDGTFGVGDEMTREQFVTILWRIACPKEYAAYKNNADNETGLADVEDDQYYTAAVNWAEENDIMIGYSSGKFGVGESITFEDMCLVLARYTYGGDDALEAALTDEDAAETLASFSDASDVSDYAVKGMAWSVDVGLVYGNSDGTLLPLEDVARERAATVIWRAVEAGYL